METYWGTPFQHNPRGNVTGLIGVRKAKAGKFAAVITDPITKRRVWLGTFNTAQEANKAYLLKKQEFLANGLLGTQRLKNGRYGAKITNPFSLKEVWLGTFDTVEEASHAYLSKKSEFAKLVKANQGEEPIICVDSSEEEPCLMANIHVKKLFHGCVYTVTSHPKAKRSILGFQRRKNGWNADVVRDLIRNKKVSLGNSDTVVEDSEACFSKNPEYETLGQGSKKNRTKNCDQTFNVGNVGRNKTIDPHKATHILGVRKSKSGRYSSEIYDRISNKKIWLGTFDTAEEASQAIQSKKLEIQKLVKAKQDGKGKLLNAKQGQETVNREGLQLESACGASSLETDIPVSNLSNGGSDQRIESHQISLQKRKLGKRTSEILLETLCTAEEAYNTYQCNKSFFQRSKKSELQSDMPTNSSAGENQQGQEDEDLWMGQWVQIPGNKEVNISLKLGVPIIDNYGYLLGDFRSIDDLRIR